MRRPRRSPEPSRTKAFAESMLTQQIAAWQATQSGRDPDTLEQQLATCRPNWRVLKARYTEDYPDVIKAKNDIAAMQKKIAENDSQKSANRVRQDPASVGRAGTDHAAASAGPLPSTK